MKHVIVGSGPAGIAAATTLRRIAPSDGVTVVAEEEHPYYSRVLTSYFVAGKVTLGNLQLSCFEQLQSQGIQLRSGKRAVKVDSSARDVLLSDGDRIHYDRLLLATGAAPAIPPVDGSALPGVFTFWSHDDALRLSAWVQEGHRAVVLGAGLVGLKVAEALMLRGLSVTVVELMDRVLPQLLALDDAALVRTALEQKGLALLTGTTAIQIAGDGRVQQLALGNGTVLNCDVVVMATGVRPNLSLARSAGASVGRAILVDPFLRTTVPDIYAAGDVAEARDLARGRRFPNPTWGNASEQGRISAYNMAGFPRPYHGAITMNSFTFLGLSMAAVGITQPEGDFCRVRVHRNPGTGDYDKLVFLGDRLIGAVSIGDLRKIGVWRGLIARGLASASAAEALLGGRAGFALAHGLGN